MGLSAFILPGIRVARDLAEPNLATAAMPRAALRLHASQTPRAHGPAASRAAGEREERALGALDEARELLDRAPGIVGVR